MSLEFYTNQELIDELFQRETFKGILLNESGERTNASEKHNSIGVRMSKGLVVKDILDYLSMGLEVVRAGWPMAFAEYFKRAE